MWAKNGTASATIRRGISCVRWRWAIKVSSTTRNLRRPLSLEVIAEAHPDSTTDDERWECVDIKAVATMSDPVTLDQIKAREDLAEMVLVKNSRLSVQPVTPEEWEIICAMGGI